MTNDRCCADLQTNALICIQTFCCTTTLTLGLSKPFSSTCGPTDNHLTLDFPSQIKRIAQITRCYFCFTKESSFRVSLLSSRVERWHASRFSANSQSANKENYSPI